MPETPPTTRFGAARWLPLAPAAGLLAAGFADGGFPPLALAVIAVAVWLLVAVTLLAGPARSRAPTVAAVAVVVVGAAFAAWTGLSLSWVSDRGSGYEDLVRVLAYLGLFALVASWSGRDHARWLEGLAFGGAAVVAAAVGSRLLGVGGEQELGELLPSTAGRLSFPLGYWNALGLLAATTASLGVWLAGSADRGWMQRAAAAVVPLCAVAILLTDSRGAMVSAAVGVAIAAAYAAEVPRATAAALLAAGSAAPACALALGSDSVRLGGVDGPYASGLAVAAALIAGALLTAIGYPVLARRLSLDRLRTGPRAVLALAAVAGTLVIVVGPADLAGSVGGRDETPAERGGSLGVDSGRSEFWSAALDAFADDPVRGIGAGGYENWWNANGSLGIPVRNAHSAPLETLAELGLVGLALLVAAVAVVGVAASRWLRSPLKAERSLGGGSLSVLAVVGIGSLLDWIWEMPAVFGAAVIAAALLCADPAGARAARAGSSRASGSRRLASWARARPPAALWRGSLAVVCVVAIAVAAPLAIGSQQLDRSEQALADGELLTAAESARAAQRLLPWSSEPDLRLAEIEQTAGNFEAARLDAGRAARENPDDYRGWALLSTSHAALGEADVGAAYANRVLQLAPLILERALLESLTR